MIRRGTLRQQRWAWLLCSLWSIAAPAQTLDGAQLVADLRAGGHVLVMRNASSPEQPPDTAAPANFAGEREINEHGQGEMGVIGYALNTLNIPIGTVMTSPAYRARQSANYLGLGTRQVEQSLAEYGPASWLVEQTATTPEAGTNTLLVTHGNLITSALGREARGIVPGELLVYRPGDAGTRMLARVKVEDWALLALTAGTLVPQPRGATAGGGD